MDIKDYIQDLNVKVEKMAPENLLEYFLKKFKGKIALSSSLSLEDQVLTHMILSIDPDAQIFTLDTGRLFPEIYDLIASTNARYKTTIKIYFPDSKSVEEMVNARGVNLFYDSIENRKMCCEVRKVDPLKRAFEELDVWICGLRREQSVTRSRVDTVEWDDSYGIIKLNPIINWKEKDVRRFISENNIPYNTMHDRGYPSIGCQPCTRAIEPGEDIRAGRWWWENPETRECGLHKR